MIFEGAKDMEHREPRDRLSWLEAARMILTLSLLLWAAIILVL